ATASKARLLTIGTVCGTLKDEFPDISISKIRYLEDQGLLAPRRTRGGYRLFSEEDVDRLQTILRLQRDEFLPLRVIRQELASPSPKERRRRRQPELGAEEGELDLGDLCERAGITAQFARELEDFGLLAPLADDGQKRYGEGDADIALLCSRLRKYNIPTAHLKRFRTDAENEAAIFEQLLAPRLRSRKPEHRQDGLEALQELVELAQELSQALFVRAVRRVAAH